MLVRAHRPRSLEDLAAVVILDATAGQAAPTDSGTSCQSDMHLAAPMSGADTA
jgi:hypothetical protein